jgi:uncharacterized repeat protein (TIGR02543 family)
LITYNSDGGTACSNKSVTYNAQYGELCVPIKTGYTFSGWYNSAGALVSASTTVSTAANHTLTAHWTTNYYTLTYDSNGGTSCTSKSVAYGAQYGTLCTPTKSGYSFTGWFTAASGGTQVSSSTIMGNGATIYAQWRKYTFAEAYSAPAYTMTGSSSSFLQSGSCTSSSSCPTGNCKNAGIVPSGATVYITGVSSLASNEVNAYVATTSFSSMGAGGNNTIAEGNHVCATTYGVPYVASDKVVYDGVTYLYVRLVFNNNGTCIISGYC